MAYWLTEVGSDTRGLDVANDHEGMHFQERALNATRRERQISGQRGLDARVTHAEANPSDGLPSSQLSEVNYGMLWGEG